MYGSSSSPAIAPESRTRAPVRSSRSRISDATTNAPANAIAPKIAAVPNSSVEIEKSPTRSAVNPATNATGPSEPSTGRMARYARSGIGNTSTRFTNPATFATTYAEKPNRYPPMSDGQNLPVTRCATRYAPHAASAGAATRITFSDASGPKAAVTGHVTNAGPGTNAAHERLTPPGADTALE